MRIDLYGSAATGSATGAEQVTGATKHAGKSQGPPQTGVAEQPVEQETDRTTLSSDSLSVASLTSHALASGAGRSDRVETLKQSVNSGDYKLEPDAIAQAILRDRA